MKYMYIESFSFDTTIEEKQKTAIMLVYKETVVILVNSLIVKMNVYV